MNKAMLYGRAGKDPVVRSVDGGNKVARFSLATSTHRKDASGNRVEDTDWHNIVAWNKLADLAENYIKKGSALIIVGQIKYRQYQDTDGMTKSITEIMAHEIFFAGKKEETTQAPAPAPNSVIDNVAGMYGRNPSTRPNAERDAYGFPGNVNNGSVPDDLDDMPF